MILQYRDIIVESREVAACRHKELLIDPRVVKVVAHRGHEDGHELQLGDVVGESAGGELAEHEDGLGHVTRVHRRVVGVARVVASLHYAEKRHQVGGIQPEVCHQTWKK